jgi:hypothetical protein
MFICVHSCPIHLYVLESLCTLFYKGGEEEHENATSFRGKIHSEVQETS